MKQITSADFLRNLIPGLVILLIWVLSIEKLDFNLLNLLIALMIGFTLEPFLAINWHKPLYGGIVDLYQKERLTSIINKKVNALCEKKRDYRCFDEVKSIITSQYVLNHNSKELEGCREMKSYGVMNANISVILFYGGIIAYLCKFNFAFNLQYIITTAIYIFISYWCFIGAKKAFEFNVEKECQYWIGFENEDFKKIIANHDAGFIPFNASSFSKNSHHKSIVKRKNSLLEYIFFIFPLKKLYSS